MAKEVLKNAGTAAFEKTLEAFMPALFQRLDQLDQRLSGLDRELYGLREHIDARYDQLRDVMNELGERMARVEGTMTLFTRSVSKSTTRKASKLNGRCTADDFCRRPAIREVYG